MQEKLRRDKDFKLLLNKLGSSVFADYGLAMKFTTPEYWAGGTKYGAGGTNLWPSTTAGFSTSNVTLSSPAPGTYRFLNVGANYGAASFSFATVPGTLYRLQGAVDVTGAAQVQLRAGFAAGQSNSYGANVIADGPVDAYFYAMDATTFITITHLNPVDALTFDLVGFSLVEQAGVTRMPGYSFTRSGEQGAVDASGAVAYFAPNVPAINTRGYHAYGALTNFQTQSQNFIVGAGGWNTADFTVTADAIAAPDGTTTMDKLVESATLTAHEFPSFQSGPSSGRCTHSIIVKALGVGSKRFLQATTGGDTAGIVNYDFVLNVVVGGGGARNTAGYIVDLGNGYKRLVFCYDAPSAVPAYWVLQNTNTTVYGGYTGDGVSGVYAWQGQHIAGEFRDGGPIIRTAGAAASIGDNLLQVSTTAPITSANQVWYAAVNLSATGNSQNLFEGVAAGGQRFVVRRQGAGDLYIFDALFGIVASTGSGIYTSGRLVVAFCLQGGLWSLRMWFGGTHQNTAGTAGNWPAGNVVTVGIGQGSIAQVDLLNGAVQFLGYKIGTFTTTEIDATLETL